MNKIPLLLVSGLLSNERVWEHSIDHLKEYAEIQIYSPKENTPEKMVEAILERAPSYFALAGHSMGGWLSLEILRKAPGRVIKLALLNTSARSDTNQKRAKRIEMIERVKKGHFREIVDELASYFVHTSRCLEEVKQMFHTVGSEAFIQQEESMLKRQECLSILPKISCPTTILYAAEDRVFSLEEHQELASLIPNATLSVIEDSGHMSPMEKPESVAALLREWLTT